MRFFQSKELYLFLLNLLARIPFINSGYGREEDAWAQVLNAKGIWESGVYEVSRLPGHPIYELLLTLLWPVHSYWLYNLLSALASSLTVVFFYRIAKDFKARQPLALALSLGFIPVFFISGTYTIDYNIATMFIIFSLYQLRKGNIIWAGILLGVASGFRISSLGFALPWIWLYSGKKDLVLVLKLFISSGIVALISFIPPLYTYGLGFLDFHKPPYSSLVKIAFKLSFGIWGILLFIYLCVSSLIQSLRNPGLKITKPTSLGIATFMIVFLQLLIFLRLPFKSEFLIPALPFILLFLDKYLSKKQLRLLPFVSILSCFLMGFDYHSPYRGASPSSISVSFNAGSKELFFDFAQGPAIIDYRKRLAKMHFVDKVATWVNGQKTPFHLIAGWYWPQLMLKTSEDKQTYLDYYSTQKEITKVKEQDYPIYYLPEINKANAIIEGHYLADSLGNLLIP